MMVMSVVGLPLNVIGSAVVFAWCWWTLYEHFGFLIGGLFGWLPAAVVGVITFLVGLAASPLLGVGVILAAVCFYH